VTADHRIRQDSPSISGATASASKGSGGDRLAAALRVIGGQVIQSQLVGLIGYSLDSAVASARGSRA
jgi:hypothetical protein